MTKGGSRTYHTGTCGVELNTLRSLAAYLFILCVPLLLVTSNLRLAVNEVRLYEYGLSKYEVSARTGVLEERLQVTAKGLISYFNSGEELLGGEGAELFNAREIAHFRDIKGLIQLTYLIQWVSLAYFLLYIALGWGLWRGRFFRPLAKAVLWGGGLTLAFLAFVGVWAIVDFDSIFELFHLVSFRNLLWMAEPGDLMIQMFPPEFFLDATLFIAAAIAIEAIIIGAIAAGYLRFSRKRL